MVLLRTKRLILREFTLDDAVALSSVDSLPEVARYNGLPPPTLEDTQRVVEFVIESSVETPRTIYTLAIVAKEDDRLVGRCGFDLGDREPGEAMVGYSLHPDSWGQGLMTEAVMALVGYGFGVLRLHRI